jgi:Protein of unknown function (DUF4231)
MAENDAIAQRLEDQIAWYDRKSIQNQRTYRRIKVFEIVAAAVIPFLAAIEVPHMKWIVGGLGVLITAFEGIIQLNQYSQNWIAYRATNEALKREKYLYLAEAGPYAAIANPRALLAERVEAIIAQENSKWVTLQQQPPKTGAQKTSAAESAGSSS